GWRDRSADVRRGRVAVGECGARGLLASGAAGDEGRPDGRASIRVIQKKCDLCMWIWKVLFAIPPTGVGGIVRAQLQNYLHRLKNGRTKPMRRIALASLLFAAFITVAPARQKNSPAAAFDRVGEFIRQQLTGRCLPSIAVAVARDGQIIWEEAFGWADRENRVPATAHTMYSLASISKPITATGLMILKERGRIEL